VKLTAQCPTECSRTHSLRIPQLMDFDFTALKLDVTEDLLPLSAVLAQRGVAHRIFEEGGQQVLKVHTADQVQEVATLYRAWRSGEVHIEKIAPGHGRSQIKHQSALASGVVFAPVTLVLITLSVAGFLAFYLRAPVEWLSLLTFTPFSATGGQIEFHSAPGQYWRLITPAFLHFGWLHIAFNSLWLWELGTKVERVVGALNTLLLFCTIALVSNTAQYVFGGPGLFGGMSGVVYGLLGFSWVGAKIQPYWQFQPPRAVMIMMVGWLLFCMAGVVQVLGFGAVANAAHLGGLLAGGALGAAFGALSRFSGDKP
jgi:rhomboid protease GlpG